MFKEVVMTLTSIVDGKRVPREELRLDALETEYWIDATIKTVLLEMGFVCEREDLYRHKRDQYLEVGHSIFKAEWSVCYKGKIVTLDVYPRHYPYIYTYDLVNYLIERIRSSFLAHE
jgi:hypothetical protein